MFKRILSAALAVLLAFSIVTIEPIRVYADSTPRYVKEIKMATGTSASQAISALKKDGYTVVNCNLREGVSGSYCYMGYKTTTNADEAVTDVRLMNAGGGISEVKYRDLVANWKSGIESSGEYLKQACLEVKANYEKGSPLAEAAVELLDLFNVEGTPLSQYLFDSARADTDYQDILLICADNVVSLIYSALYMGTADYNVDDFAARLQRVNAADFDAETIAAQPENAEYIACWANTARVVGQLQTFAEEYDEAVAYFKEYRVDEELADEDDPITQEELCNYWRQFAAQGYEESADEEEQQLYEYATVVGVYEKLSGYACFDSRYKTLADYIYACGNPLDDNDEESDLVYYRVYPLVSVLTPGQVFTLQYGGLSTLVSALGNNVDSYREQTSAALDVIREKIAAQGLSSISVFYNVNREIYDETVAFTDEAHRIADASAAYESLTQTFTADELTQTLTEILFIGGIVAVSVLAATVLFLGVSAAFFGTTAMTLLSVGYLAILSGSIAIASGGMTLTTAAIVTGIIGVSVVIVIAVILAVLVICALIQFFKTIFSDDDGEETPDYPDMPAVIFDVVGNEFTQYNAVTDLSGALTDINGGSGTQWDGLYYTCAASAGSPIRADDAAFTFSKTSYVAPDGTVAVKRMGYVSTANFHTYKKNAETPLYLFYYSQAGEQETGSLYLYDLALLSGDTAEEARLGLLEKDYIVIERDLTPNSNEYTYLGYKTTDRAGDAITDIRIAYYYDAEKFVYGTTAAGSAAEYALVGQLNTMASLYYVKQASNGSPILADILVTQEQLGADSGYEPVNLFCGGNAFNLLIGSDSYSGIAALEKGSWDETLYLYFRPSVAYTSGTEYISGFAFSSGFENNLEFAAQCGFKPVESLSDYNLTDGLTENPTYLLYSTTYNPYRAVTAIRTYTSQCSSDATFENMTVGTTGYAACETFACIKDIGAFSYTYYRLLRPSNSFITRHSYEGSAAFDLDSEYQALNNLGKYAAIPQTGLFVAGPSPTAKPLTTADVFYTTNQSDNALTSFTNAAGESVACRPVNDLSDCYSTEAKNLTFEWDYAVSSSRTMRNTYAWNVTFENYLYIYYRGSVPTRGKYVCSVYVATVEPEDGDYAKYAPDQAIAKALSNGEGELIKINLAREASDQPLGTETYVSRGETYTRDVFESCGGTASYLFVQYTDYRIESMRAAVRQWYDDDESAAKTLQYQNTTFTRGGDVVKGISGDYGIYVSANGQLGAAVTDVILDTEYLTEGCISIGDVSGINSIGEDYLLKLSSGGDVGDVYYTDIVVASASSRTAAIKELYRQGCNGFIDRDKNRNGGGDYVYIGYKTTIDADDENVITGLKIVVSEYEITDDNVTRVTNAVENSTLLFSGPSSKRKQEQQEVQKEMVYTRVSGDLNAGIGGDYTYLYISRSTCANPITRLTLESTMTATPAKFIDYSSHNWITTANASSGSDADVYCLCYRQQSSDWSLYQTEHAGWLSIKTVGDMEDYQDAVTVKYLNVIPLTVTYYPEWYECADAITDVSVGETVTRLDDCALRGCERLESVSFYNRDCVIEEGAIPDGVLIVGYAGSTAEEYAAAHGMEFFDMGKYRVGTALQEINVVFVSVAAAALCLAGAAAYVIIKKKKRKQKAGEVSDVCAEKIK